MDDFNKISVINNPSTSDCVSVKDIEAKNGAVIENDDGTISVYDEKGHPNPLNETCCEFLNPNYFWDINTQKCRWSVVCSLVEDFKITLNPNGNDGTLFNVGENETCYLDIKFDYLFKFNCETLNNLLTGSPIPSTNQEEITAISLEITEQEVICESLSEKIITYKERVENTPYSIFCDSQVKPPQDNIPLDGQVSGFLPLAYNNPKIIDSKLPISSSIIYCLIEPSGLTKWAEILGRDAYNSFIEGDVSSYTCDNINTIISAQEQARFGTVYIVQCKTPFGAKTRLIEILRELESEHKMCKDTLIKLNEELDKLTEIDTTVVGDCGSPIKALESLDISLLLEVVNGTTLETVLEMPLFPEIGGGNLYNYLTTNTNSGFFICGDPDSSEPTFSSCTPVTLEGIVTPHSYGTTSNLNVNSCDSVTNSLINDLFDESGLGNSLTDRILFNNSLSIDIFKSNWLDYVNTITDEGVLEQIKNKKLKLSFKINNSCGDFCILVDNIKLNKNCTVVTENKLFVTQSPGFKLNRIRDNKKSWINNTTRTNRPFDIRTNIDTNIIRQTDYNVNDERLVINSKEIDLNVDIADAIETDVWCYISDNSCILTGTSNCNSCVSGCCGDNLIDFNTLLTESLTGVTTIEEFEYFITSQLIDVKNRQSISSYPTLRALYNRYINSVDYCDTRSSAFTYVSMEQFTGLLKNYWTDLIEQVVPATTIWGSVKVYSNTIFDQQKFQYKKNSLVTCSDLSSKELKGSVGVNLTNISINGKKSTCMGVYVAPNNHESEFMGTVTVILGGADGNNNNVSNDGIFIVKI